jgi:hypothetical protein
MLRIDARRIPPRSMRRIMRRGGDNLAARGESPTAFGRRCIPPGCVASPSNIPDILGRHALPAGRIAGLGATPAFHHGLLGHEVFAACTDRASGYGPSRRHTLLSVRASKGRQCRPAQFARRTCRNASRRGTPRTRRSCSQPRPRSVPSTGAQTNQQFCRFACDLAAFRSRGLHGATAAADNVVASCASRRSWSCGVYACARDFLRKPACVTR